MITIAISACLLGENCRYDGCHKGAAWASALDAIGDVHWIPFCPERDAGLGVPREPMNLVTCDRPDATVPRVLFPAEICKDQALEAVDDLPAMVTVQTLVDHGRAVRRFTHAFLDVSLKERLRHHGTDSSVGVGSHSGPSYVGGNPLSHHDIPAPFHGMIVKSRSPSCALNDAPRYRLSEIIPASHWPTPHHHGPGLFVSLVQKRYPALAMASEEDLVTLGDLMEFLNALNH